MKPLVPEVALNQHIALLGKTGAGKSYAARGIVEYLLDDNRRVCVLDPKGDWWGLRLSDSGKSAGYPVVIFGGSHGDLPINAHSGGQIAELVATGNRPTILDMSELTIGERTRLFMDFAAGLFRHNRGPLWLVIDEVHNFAHQGKVHDVDAGKMLHWANRLASEGRGKGIQIIMASQRPQKVHKDTLTCAETLVAMRVVHNLDRGAIKEWMDGAGDKDKSDKVLKSLASMARGEAWVWSPELGHFEHAKAPKITTYDSMSPTPVGSESLKGWAEVDLEEVRAKLADVVKEAEANDPKLLRQEIARLKKLTDAKPAAAVDQSSIDRAVESAVAKRDREWQASLKERESIIDSLKGRMGKAAAILHVNGEVTPQKPAPVFVTQPALQKPRPALNVTQPAVQKVGEHALGKCERAILTAMHWLRDEDVTPAKVGFYSNYSASSGGFNNSLGKLRSMGLVQGWKITDSGQAVAKSLGVGSKPSGQELREWLRPKLGRAENAILDVLTVANGARCTSEELGKATGYSANSGGFNNALGKLRSIEAAVGYERDGGTKAADVFFELTRTQEPGPNNPRNLP